MGTLVNLALGAMAVPANRHDSPLLEPTLETLKRLGSLPDTMSIHLDRGYDSGMTRERLAARGLRGEIAARGTSAPLTTGRRWVVERTNAWINAYTNLV